MIMITQYNKISPTKLMALHFNEFCDLERDLPHPGFKFQCSTSDEERHLTLKVVNDEPQIFDQDVGLNFFEEDYIPHEEDNESLIKFVEEIKSPTKSDLKPRKNNLNKKGKKNSNAIKKMGRIILKKLEEYELEGETNTGVQNMMKKLEQRCSKKDSKCFVDGFNTYHLQALFDVPEAGISRYNLRTTRKLFTTMLRSEVLNSYQIKGEGKLLYLNTLKCSSLRFINKKLANRLQNSESPPC